MVVDEFETFEVDELLSSRYGVHNIQIVLLNDSTIIDLVAYYPSVEIQNNKFIHKVRRCGKAEDIDLAVESLSRKIRKTECAAGGVRV
jgi:hypothetical protein